MDFTALKAITDHPLSQVISQLVGVIGVVLGYILYRLAQKETRPRYCVEAGTLMGDMSTRLTGLEVHFAGKRQPRVTVAKVYFWNDGRLPIKKEDIAVDDPLKIDMRSGADVLSARVRAVTRNACKVSIGSSQSVDEKRGIARIPIDLAFLDYRDGFVVEVVHNGPSNHPLRISGTIVGAEPFERVSFYPSGRAYGGRWSAIFWFVSWGTVFVFGSVGYLVGTIFLADPFPGALVGAALAMLLTSYQMRLSDLFVPRLPKALHLAVPPGEFFTWYE